VFPLVVASSRGSKPYTKKLYFKSRLCLKFTLQNSLSLILRNKKHWNLTGEAFGSLGMTKIYVKRPCSGYGKKALFTLLLNLVQYSSGAILQPVLDYLPVESCGIVGMPVVFNYDKFT
jgi:hypothetical protein